MSVSALRVLHDEIAARTGAISAARGTWPCRKGCDACCRHLAAVPQLTAPEWHLLCEGMERLSAEVRQRIDARLRALRDARPVLCPFLDESAGACSVYEYRPIACRTYGFYVEREGGLYCDAIRALVDAGECESVVWGNGAAVAAKAGALGPATDLREWRANYPAEVASRRSSSSS